MVRGKSISYQKKIKKLLSSSWISLEKILEANTVLMSVMLVYRTTSLPLNPTSPV